MTEAKIVTKADKENRNSLGEMERGSTVMHKCKEKGARKCSRSHSICSLRQLPDTSPRHFQQKQYRHTVHRVPRRNQNITPTRDFARTKSKDETSINDERPVYERPVERR